VANRLGRYEVVRRLAVGGMGEVFLARDGEHELILKALLPQHAADPTLLAQFYDEARLCQHLDHPNVVKVHDVTEVAGVHLIAMDYIRGRDLTSLQLDAKRLGMTLPVSVAAAIAREAARGLDYAHKATDEKGRPLKVVHRDVTPGNVMVGDDGRVRVLDFGIALAANRSAHTATGVLKGTLSYMSPEQMEGDKVTPKSDQFALGVVLWELLAARRLFDGNGLQILQRMHAGHWPAPTEYAKDTPRALEAIVMRMLSRAPAERYDDCAQLAQELDRWLATQRGPTVESFVQMLGPRVDSSTAMLAALKNRPISSEPTLDHRRPVAEPLRAMATPAQPVASVTAVQPLEELVTARPTLGRLAAALVFPLRHAGAWVPLGVVGGALGLFGPIGEAAGAAMLLFATVGALNAVARDHGYGVPALGDLLGEWLWPAIRAALATAPVWVPLLLLERAAPAWLLQGRVAVAIWATLDLPYALLAAAGDAPLWRLPFALLSPRPLVWRVWLFAVGAWGLVACGAAAWGARALHGVAIPVAPYAAGGLLVFYALLVFAAALGEFAGTDRAPQPTVDAATQKIERALERSDLEAALDAWQQSARHPPAGMSAATLLSLGRAAAVLQQHDVAELALSLSAEAEDPQAAAKAKVLLARLYRERLQRPAEAEVLLTDVVEHFADTDAAKVAAELLKRR